jgi:hypothetical protein
VDLSALPSTPDTGVAFTIKCCELPDSVACLVACRGAQQATVVLVDDTKPYARQHLLRLLADLALISLPMGLADLLGGLAT